MIECGSTLDRLIVTMYEFPAKPSQEQCKANWEPEGQTSNETDGHARAI